MGRAKRAAIPIEVIRQEVDDAEKIVEALLARRPVIRSRENDARAMERGSGRVETPVEDLNQRTLEEVGVPQSSIRTFASKRDAPSVALSSTGIPPKIPRLSNPQVLICPLSSQSSEKVDFGPDPPNPNLSLNIPLNPILSIGPKPSPSKLPSQSPHYFVTEPTSPKATSDTSISHATPLSPSKPTIVEITPPSSPRDSANKGSPKSLVPFLTPNNPPSTTSLSIPEKSSSPQHPDIPLTSVFRSLAIKRRASDDLEEQGTPKILRLCSSGVDPIIPKHKPSRPTRATSKVRRKPLSLSNGFNYDDNSMVMDNGLCEVQI